MPIRTLNQIIGEFNEIATQHRQINNFTVGTIEDFATSGTTNYPAWWVGYDSNAFASRTEDFTFTFWLVDRVKKDRSNLIEIHSDMKQVAMDVIAQLNDSGYGWKVSESVNLSAIYEPFHEDEIAGWSFDFTISQPFTKDICQIPFISPIAIGRSQSGYNPNTPITYYVPTTRELTIDGVTYDLSTNRSWTTSGSISGNYVPYTGANNNVDLGEYEIKTGQITLDTSPTGIATVGTTRWNDSIGSIETTLKGGNVIIKNGVDLVARVVNKVSPNTTLTKANYQVVKVTGAQGQRLAVNLAQANNDNNSADTLGVVTETIATNQEGFIITVGQIEEINTTGSLQGETWNDGDVLYLSPTTAGKMTNVKPNGSTGHIVILGYVEYAHSQHGKIYVKIMNGWELDELHNVYINPSTVANNDILVYSSGTTLWQNKNIYTSIGNASTSTTGLLTSTDWNTFNAKLDNNAWVDYSATSTITGWSSFVNKVLRYKVVGKQVFVSYLISGTSNSTSTSFTLPFTSVSAQYNEAPNRSFNNGVAYHGFGIIAASSATMSFSYWTTATANTSTWTASGTKWISGQIFYEIA
jgi:nitrogen fixation protein